MTYIDLINRFWQIDLEAQFTGNETKLYFALLHIANQLHWSKSELSIPNNRLLAMIGCTKSTLIDARNKLVQYELISYEKGNRRLKSGKYKIIGSRFGSNIDPKSVPKGIPKTVPNNVPKPLPYKRKDKKREEKVENNKKKTETEFFQSIIAAYNENCKSLPRAIKLTEDRVKKLRKATETIKTLEEWVEIFKEAEKTPFVKGEIILKAGEKPWVANFDWFIKNDNNGIKVLERVYDGMTSQPTNQSKKDTSDLVRGHDYGTNYDTDDNALIREVLENEQRTSTELDKEREQKSIAWQNSTKR